MPKPWELKQSGGATASSTTPSAKPWELQLSEQTPPPTLPPTEPESEAGFGENFGKGFVSGIYNIGTFMYGAAEAAHRPIVGDTSLSDLLGGPAQLGMKLFAPETAKSMRDGTADILAGLADQSAKMSAAVLETGEYAKGLEGDYDVPLVGSVNVGDLKFDRGADPESWGVAFGSGAASLLPIVATGGLGAGAAIPTVGLQSFGATYHRARSAYEEQGLSTEEAAQSAMIPALGQASVDMLLTKAGGMLAKKTGATNIEALRTSVRSAGFRDGVKTLSGKLGLKLKAATKGALIEGTIEEAPANFIGEYFIARNSFDPTVTLEQAGQEAWKSWVVGAGLGGGMGMAQRLDTHDDVTAAAREAARRETIRSVAPATAEKLDARDAASLVLPDGEEGVGTLEPVRVDGLPDEGETKPVFPESAREKVVQDAQEKGTLPLWWDRYEDSVGPEDTTVPSGLRHADQATVDRFIEEQEAYNELSQFEIEKHPEFEEWAVLRKGEVVGAFESEEQARDAAREMALKAVPKKTQAQIKRYKEFTRKLTELGKLDDLYQSQLDLAKQRTAEAELATTPEVISDEDKQFVAEKLGITVEDLKYSGLNITQEMVNELRYAPEGAGIREFLNKAEQIRRESPKTPFSELGESRKVQDEAKARAAEIKEERDLVQFEAELIAAKIAADSIKSDTEMRLGLEQEADTERVASEDEAGVPPALRGTNTRRPRNSQQLGQLAEVQLEEGSLNPTDRTVLNRLVERKANLVADSYGVKDPQQQDNFVQSVVQIDNQIADLLGTERATPATQADLASMQSTFEDVAVEPAPTEPEQEPITTMKIGDTEIKVVNRSSGISGVASAARPSVTAQQMEPALLKQIEAALVKISKRFGSLLNLSEIQLTKLAGGAGVASIARSGVTDAILVDIEKLLSSTSNKKFSLEKALEEELIHNLDGQALRAEYASLITSGQLSPAVDVRSFIESKYNDIYNNMTADEKAAARVLYGNDFIDGVHMAQEFVRQLIQKRHTKTITEESYRGKPIRKLLDIFSRMFSRMGLSGPLQAHVANVESFLERTYKLEAKEATTAEAKQRLKEEKAERKKLIGKKAKDQTTAYNRIVEAVAKFSHTESGKWLATERGQDYGARVVDETYDAWVKRYNSDEGFRDADVPPPAYFWTVVTRKAINLAQAEFGTEKRGKDIAFTSADTLKDEGIEPATFTPAGESMNRTILAYKDEIGLTQQEQAAVQSFLTREDNASFARQLKVTPSRASQVKASMIAKLRKAAYTNPELLSVLVDAAQSPSNFTADVVASAADPNAPSKNLPPAYKRIARFLTKPEKAKMRARTAQDIVDVFNSLPPDQNFITAAKMGEAKRGWYKRAGVALRQMFGGDTDQFVALLAAHSPQQSVLENLRMSLSTWAEWVEAGRPSSDSDLLDIYKKVGGASLGARVGNANRALRGEALINLSGFKVESFRKNLLGDLSASTNDTWMALFGGVSQNIFSTKSGYLGFTAKVRRVADKLGWEPAEVQETVWSFFKTLYEKQTEGKRAGDLIEGITDEEVSSTPEFYEYIISDEKSKAKLKQLGIDISGLKDLGRIGGRGGSSNTPTGDRLGASDRVAVRRIARRATDLKEQRLAEQAAKRNLGAAFAADPNAGLAFKVLAGMANIKKHVFRFFDSSGGLKMPSAMNADKQLNLFQPKIDKDAYINSVMGVVRAENRNLKLAIKNELGKATEKDVATINSALNGDAASMAELTPAVQDAVRRMREQIDGLSRHLISKGWITGDLRAKVEGNLGTYLARSYRIFDEADYTVDDEVKNKAINFLEKRLIADGLDPAKAQLRADNLVKEMLRTYNKRGAADTMYGRLGEKDLSLFMKRKDIAPEIRALLGEYKDPLMNYTRSVSRLASFAGNHRFLTELKKIGMGQIFFEKGDDAGRNAADANTPITGRVAGVKIAEGEEDASRGSYSPLSGLYTTEDVNEILESFERASSLSNSPFWRFLAKANVLSKTAKTVMSVMTNVRNLFGQPYFLLLNGHNPFAFRKAWKALNAIYADAAGNNRESQMYFNKMTRLGLVGEEVTTAELQRVMKDQQQFLDEAVDATELMDKGLGASLLAWKKAKKGFQALARVYRASDELGKIINFEIEKEALRPIRPDATEAELEAEAAVRTRGGFPTYSEIPPAIQKLRMQPFVGPFMSFFYEAVRTQVMNVKYAAQEMSGPTNAHKKYAFRRIGGHLAATVGMGYVMQELFKALSGISDEEEENVRSLMADYEKDGQFIFWRDEDKQIQYINLSFNNPYATTTDQTLALLGISGADDTSGLVDNIISRSVAMLAPFTSETIIAQAVIDQTRNETVYGSQVFNPEAPLEEQMVDRVSHIARAFTPGTVDRAINKWIPAAKGETLRSGQKPELVDELTAEFTGFKVRTLDYQEALMKNSAQTSRRITSANSLFNSVSGSRASNVSNEDMLAAYDDANQSRYKIFQHAYRQIKAARAGGLTDSEITRSMKTGGVSASDITLLRQGLYRPMSPSPSILTNARKFGHPIPIRDINQLKRKWLRKPLTD
jgi:hypothetical protein